MSGYRAPRVVEKGVAGQPRPLSCGFEPDSDRSPGGMHHQAGTKQTLEIQDKIKAALFQAKQQRSPGVPTLATTISDPFKQVRVTGNQWREAVANDP